MTKVKQAERNWAGALDRETDALLAGHQSIVNGEEDSLVRAIIDHIDANPTPKMAAVIEALERIAIMSSNHSGWVENDFWGGLSEINNMANQALSQLKDQPND